MFISLSRHLIVFDIIKLMNFYLLYSIPKTSFLFPNPSVKVAYGPSRGPEERVSDCQLPVCECPLILELGDTKWRIHGLSQDQFYGLLYTTSVNLFITKNAALFYLHLLFQYHVNSARTLINTCTTFLQKW